MGYLSPCVAATITTVLVSGYLGPSVGAKSPASISSSEQIAASATSVNSVVRERKGPLLAPRRPAGEQAQAITEIDVVGLHGATITFRDAQGRVLFRTDRVTNTTTVSKGVVLPEVTVRETARGQVRRLPVEVPQPVSLDSKPPDYCEPAFSPVAAPSLSQIPGRCVAEIAGKEKFAVLR